MRAYIVSILLLPMALSASQSYEFDAIKESSKELLKDLKKSNEVQVKVINAEPKFEERVRALDVKMTEALPVALEIDRALERLEKKDDTALCAILGRMPSVISRSRDRAWESGKRIFHKNTLEVSQKAFGITSYCGLSQGSIDRGDSSKLKQVLNEMGDQVLTATKKQL
jgi:hypothetical protein